MSIPSILNEAVYQREAAPPHCLAASLPHCLAPVRFLMEISARAGHLLRLFGLHVDGVSEGFQSSCSLHRPSDNPEGASPIIWEILWCLANDANVPNKQLPSKTSAVWKKHQIWDEIGIVMVVILFQNDSTEELEKTGLLEKHQINKYTN